MVFAHAGPSTTVCTTLCEILQLTPFKCAIFFVFIYQVLLDMYVVEI